MGHPLPPALRRGLLSPCWGLTPVLPTLLWVGMGPAGPAAAALSLIFLATGLCSRIFSFHSTAKGYDKTTPWPMVLLRPIPSSWGVSPDQWQSLKRPCQPKAALLGLPWANDVASNTLCPSSMRAHCRERDWDQRGGNNGEPRFWPCIRMGIPSPIHPV